MSFKLNRKMLLLSKFQVKIKANHLLFTNTYFEMKYFLKLLTNRINDNLKITT